MNDQIVANGSIAHAPNRLEAQRRERSAINELAIKLHYCDVLVSRANDQPWGSVAAPLKAVYVLRATRYLRESDDAKAAIAKLAAEEAIHVELERRAIDLATGVEVTSSRVFAARLLYVSRLRFEGSLCGQKAAE